MVEKNDIDQMAKFMAALNGGDAITESASGIPARPSVPTTGSAADVDAMKDILTRFHSTTDQVINESAYDRELREALMTEATPTGARIGSWEIQVHQEGARKLYNVVNLLSNEPLAIDLLLYEAAHGLVRILNEGGRINSHNAIELLRMEREYGSLVQDMALYKHRLQSNPQSPRRTIYEARYGDAKRRALAARGRVTKLSEGR